MVTVQSDGYAEFRFFRPEARHVAVAGDFNSWRMDQLKMIRQKDGYWVLKVLLPTGDYKFRYVADGLWYTDFAAFGLEPGRFGLDSLVRVPPRRLEMKPQAAVATAAESQIAAA